MPRKPDEISGLAPPLRLSERVFRLGTYHLPSFLIKGRLGCALFETGISATAPVVLAQLKRMRIASSRIKWLILSHAHSDHAAGQAGLRAGLERATLLLSAASARHLQKPATARAFAGEDAFTSAAVCRLLGREAKTPALTTESLLPAPWQTIEAGQSLNLGGARVEFLGAKGHVPGGLLAWLPAEKLLLASDSAGFCASGRISFPLYFTSYAAYLENIKALRGLRPQVLALGHQDWFAGPDVGRYFDRLVRYLKKEHAKTLSRAAAGETAQEQVRRLVERYYRDELTIYPRKVIAEACRYLVRRDLESGPD
jgi:glyoxylase-like metal-dependent hydrolase (beta-lactamase superfamily II)